MKLWMIVMALAQDDAAAELGQAGTKAQEWKSYSFKVVTKTEGAPQRNQGGGQDNAGPRTTEGEYVADKGLHAKSGQGESIRKGEKTAIKGRDGKWSAPQSGGGQGQGGRRGGGRGFGAMPAPHESFKDIEKNFVKIEKSTDGDAAVFSGELTTEGVAKLSGGRGFGRGGQGGDAPQSSGTAKVWVDSSGSITKIEVKSEVKGKFQDREFDVKTERTVEISNVGAADFEIPEEAKAILEK